MGMIVGTEQELGHGSFVELVADVSVGTDELRQLLTKVR
jgi:hypothetical protein